VSADDIVTRLRICRLEYGTGEVCVEAADEIERLRAEVDKWRKIADERNPHSWRNLVKKRYGMEDMYER